MNKQRIAGIALLMVPVGALFIAGVEVQRELGWAAVHVLTKLLFSVFILLTCLAFGVELLFDSYENSQK